MLRYTRLSVCDYAHTRTPSGRMEEAGSVHLGGGASWPTLVGRRLRLCDPLSVSSRYDRLARESATEATGGLRSPSSPRSQVARTGIALQRDFSGSRRGQGRLTPTKYPRSSSDVSAVTQ